MPKWLSGFLKPRLVQNPIESHEQVDWESEFGRDLQEERQVDSNLKAGIALANAGKVPEAAKVFRQYVKNSPDWDVPHIWLAETVKRTEGPAKGLELMRRAAKTCRRKHILLQEAGELALMHCQKPDLAVRLLAQAVLASPSITGGDLSTERSVLVLKEIFTCFASIEGFQWAARHEAGFKTSLNVNMSATIQSALPPSPAIRASIKQEVRTVTGVLVKLVS